MNVHSLSRRLFWIISGVIGLLLSFQVLDLQPFIVDAELRQRLMVSMQSVTDENGWLLSDLHLQCADSAPLWIVHQTDHLRFAVPEAFAVPYPYAALDSSLPGCAD